MTHTLLASTPIAHVNGIALQQPGEQLDAPTLRQRACSELLRQAAITAGLLSRDDAASPDGVLSEQASSAIEALLAQQLHVPEPSEPACLRHYHANLARYTRGERVHVRHILFAVTPGVDVTRLRQRAESCLLDVRCHDAQASDDAFAQQARALSNCPSGAEGGQLGWLTADECAPEFAKDIFGAKDMGVLPRLVHSRFGLHVVEVLGRQAGEQLDFAAVRGAVAMALRQNSTVTALRQYLSLLAGAAQIGGVDIDATDTPLVQ